MLLVQVYYFRKSPAAGLIYPNNMNHILKAAEVVFISPSMLRTLCLCYIPGPFGNHTTILQARKRTMIAQALKGMGREKTAMFNHDLKLYYQFAFQIFFDVFSQIKCIFRYSLYFLCTGMLY